MPSCYQISTLKNRAIYQISNLNITGVRCHFIYTIVVVDYTCSTLPTPPPTSLHFYTCICTLRQRCLSNVGPTKCVSFSQRWPNVYISGNRDAEHHLYTLLQAKTRLHYFFCHDLLFVEIMVCLIIIGNG